MRALLVEDDGTLAHFVEKGLKEAAFVVDHAPDGVRALELARSVTYDVIVMDLMLPGVDGGTVIQKLRQEGSRVPILVLTARQTVSDRVEGLEKGADDYLTKPFAFPELLARVHALIRRATSAPSVTHLTVGDLRLDLLARRAWRGEREIELRPREFALLEYLMRNAGRVVSKTMILSHVWDYAFDPQTNVVDVLVFRLRDKIDRDFPTRLIHTVRGSGYVLRPS